MNQMMCRKCWNTLSTCICQRVRVTHPSARLSPPEEFELSIAALIADAEAICIHAAKTFGGDA